MPQPKDITGDLGKLSRRKVLPTGTAPVLPKSTLERNPAFNSLSFFFWTVIFLFLGLQVGFLVWLR